jgi:hypothetical protein
MLARISSLAIGGGDRLVDRHHDGVPIEVVVGFLPTSSSSRLGSHRAKNLKVY